MEEAMVSEEWWDSSPRSLEPEFQSQLTTEAVLNMIRDGSYASKLREFVRSQQQPMMQADGDSSTRTLLFHKDLTPSDVGKLNRLVIPKRYAVKHFPSVPEDDQQQVHLHFYDTAMTLWKFRYCYWKSSQTFVFTKGWNRFVKDKGLTSNHTVAFYAYQTQRNSFLLIDVTRKPNPSPPPKGFRLFGVQID